MKTILITALFTAFMLPMTVAAEELENNNIALELHDVVETLDMTLEDDLFEMAAESDSTLDEIRGTFGIDSVGADTLSIVSNSGLSQNNTNIGGFTGENSISDSAFNNSSGISFVVQNSGINSVVNAGLVVNLSLTQ